MLSDHKVKTLYKVEKLKVAYQLLRRVSQRGRDIDQKDMCGAVKQMVCLLGNGVQQSYPEQIDTGVLLCQPPHLKKLGYKLDIRRQTFFRADKIILVNQMNHHSGRENSFSRAVLFNRYKCRNHFIGDVKGKQNSD